MSVLRRELPQVGASPRAESVHWVPRLPGIYRYSSLFCATTAACIAYYGVFILRFTVRGFATLLAATLFGDVPRAIRRIGLDRLHKHRAEYANWIVNTPSALAETAHSSPLFLMIRAFRGDYTRIVDNDFAILATPFNPVRYLLSRIRPIEALLTEAVQQWGPILAFSEPVEHLPSREMLRHDYVPGYATLPEDGWFEKFADIARVSAGIIIFPSATESIIRELQWIIRNGYLDKAVFVMSPEELSPVQSFSFVVFFKHFLPKQVTDPIDDDIKRQSEFWEDARKECACVRDRASAIQSFRTAFRIQQWRFAQSH